MKFCINKILVVYITGTLEAVQIYLLTMIFSIATPKPSNTYHAPNRSTPMRRDILPFSMVHIKAPVGIWNRSVENTSHSDKIVFADLPLQIRWCGSISSTRSLRMALIPRVCFGDGFFVPVVSTWDIEMYWPGLLGTPCHIENFPSSSAYINVQSTISSSTDGSFGFIINPRACASKPWSVDYKR